tara:strand:- start:162 stop:389 length:228 start_codon:yes stop_codon:yes gene_type:complete
MLSGSEQPINIKHRHTSPTIFFGLRIFPLYVFGSRLPEVLNVQYLLGYAKALIKGVERVEMTLNIRLWEQNPFLY